MNNVLVTIILVVLLCVVSLVPFIFVRNQIRNERTIRELVYVVNKQSALWNRYVSVFEEKAKGEKE